MVSAFIVDFLMIMAAYITFLFLIFMGADWLSQGFLAKWIMVRMSRGKKWLVRSWLLDGDVRYYRGQYDGNMLRYKDKDKQFRRIRVHPEAVYRSYGVKCVEVNDELNAVRHVEGEPEHEGVVVRGIFEPVTGYDAVATDNLIVRALTLPKKLEKRDLIILLLILLIVGLAAFGAYMGYDTNKVVRSTIVAAGGPVI